MTEDKKKNKLGLIIVGLVILVGVIVAVIAIVNNNQDDEDQNNNNQEEVESEDDQSTEDQDNDNQEEVESEDDQSTEDQEEDGQDNDSSNGDIETIKATIDNLQNSLMALEADFNWVIENGCGDNLDDFNQNVTDLLSRYTTETTFLVNFGSQISEIDPTTVDAEDKAVVELGFQELQTLSTSLEAKNLELADIADGCHAE